MKPWHASASGMRATFVTLAIEDGADLQPPHEWQYRG